MSTHQTPTVMSETANATTDFICSHSTGSVNVPLGKVDSKLLLMPLKMHKYKIKTTKPSEIVQFAFGGHSRSHICMSHVWTLCTIRNTNDLMKVSCISSIAGHEGHAFTKIHVSCYDLKIAYNTVLELDSPLLLHNA